MRDESMESEQQSGRGREGSVERLRGKGTRIVSFIAQFRVK